MSGISLAGLFEGQRSALAARLGPDPDPQRVLAEMRYLFESLGHAVAAEATERAERSRLMLESLRGGVIGSFLSLRLVPPAARAGEQRHEIRQRTGILNAIGDVFSPRQRAQPAGRDEARPPNAQPSGAGPTVDVVRLLDQLRGMFEAADRLLAAAEPPPPTIVRAPWSEDSELLDLCQDLLEAQTRGDGTLALLHVERVRRSLPLRHGVKVVEFDGTNEEMFRFRTGTEPDTEVHTVRPALVVGDRVLRGEVCQPPAQLDDAALAPAEPETPEPVPDDTPTEKTVDERGHPDG